MSSNVKKWVVGVLVIALAIIFIVTFYQKSKDEVQSNQVIIPLTALDLEKIQSYHLVEETEADIDGDNILEMVQLYVDAEFIEGDYAWDDGQRWFLQIKDGDRAYVLYDDYLQLGTLEAKVYENLTTNTYHVTVTMVSGAGFEIKDYYYNFSTLELYGVDVFKQDNINHPIKLSVENE